MATAQPITWFAARPEGEKNAFRASFPSHGKCEVDSQSNRYYIFVLWQMPSLSLDWGERLFFLKTDKHPANSRARLGRLSKAFFVASETSGRDLRISSNIALHFDCKKKADEECEGDRKVFARIVTKKYLDDNLLKLRHFYGNSVVFLKYSHEIGHSSQHQGHSRPESGRLVDVRQSLSLAQLNGPFDTLAHTPDLRQDGLVDGRQWPEQLSANGRHTLRRLALHIWRLNSYPLERAPARLVDTATGGGRSVAFFTFDILGQDTPHYHRPQPIQAIAEWLSEACP